MPPVAKMLSEKEVRALAKKPGAPVCVSPNLYLQRGAAIDEDGRPRQLSWIYRYMHEGKRRDHGLGSYQLVTLSEARDAVHDLNRKLRREGIDPLEEKARVKAAKLAEKAKAVTFKEAAKAYMAAHEASWRNAKHRWQWQSTLEKLAYPHIGDLPVGDIEVAHVLAILEPVWAKRTETASRLRGRIELVLDWATARGYREGLNPARWRGHLDKMLANPTKIKKSGHMEALPVEEVGGFMEKLRAVGGMGARALEFAILTATRSGEVRGATWAEIDLKGKVWTIPAARMKMGREHRVPLSAEALKLLEKLPRIAGSDLVFPATSGKELSDRTLLAVLRRMGLTATTHGFRSTFRDWCGEYTNFPREVAEAALAHAVGDRVEQAYRRGDALEKRRKLMEAWAKFCGKAQAAKPAGDNVTPMRGRG